MRLLTRDAIYRRRIPLSMMFILVGVGFVLIQSFFINLEMKWARKKIK